MTWVTYYLVDETCAQEISHHIIVTHMGWYNSTCDFLVMHCGPQPQWPLQLYTEQNDRAELFRCSLHLSERL